LRIDVKGRLSKQSFKKEERISGIKKSYKTHFFQSGQVQHLNQIPVNHRPEAQWPGGRDIRTEGFFGI
jgi:hypothetical protein